MMRNLAETLTFTVPLGSSAHRLANQFWSQQSNQKKAKQVYLNTLAVSAVQFYLRCMGIETNWEASLSFNPVMQSLMDVADLEVSGLGKLECRPVLPQDNLVQIPPEVWSDRIGYVGVQLNQSLSEATLLGFTKTAPVNGELPVSQLRSLEDLLLHLRQIGQAESAKMQVHLSKWLEEVFEAGWQSLEALLFPNERELVFRNDFQSRIDSIKGAKLIDLGLQLGSQSVALLVAVTPEAEQKVGILVQVHPIGEKNHLPPNLKLALLSESAETLQEVQSRGQDNYIQLKRFRGQPGECFKIQVVCGDVNLTETFVI